MINSILCNKDRRLGIAASVTFVARPNVAVTRAAIANSDLVSHHTFCNECMNSVAVNGNFRDEH